MAEVGSKAEAGQPIMGVGPDGTMQFVAVDSNGNLSGSYNASVSFTCGTSPYAIADAVGASGAAAALSFTSMGPSTSGGGRIMLTSASLEIDVAAAISGETSYTLYLYNVTPPSALNDSAGWTLPAGDRAAFLGAISLGTPVLPQPGATTLYIEVTGINKQIKLLGTTLFAYLVTNGAYTPTARVFVINLHAIGL